MTDNHDKPPEHIYVHPPGILQRHLGGREGRWTEWVPSEGEIIKYTRPPQPPSDKERAEALAIINNAEVINRGGRFLQIKPSDAEKLKAALIAAQVKGE